MTRHFLFPSTVLILASAAATLFASAALAQGTLSGRASLPAATFADGPPSGGRVNPANGFVPPFPNQPVQGFSGIQPVGDGTYWMLSDNGFGSLENSADYNLRIYRVAADFKAADGAGSGEVQALGFIELHDPDKHVPFAITNFFTDERVLTGADFDIESLVVAPDGTLWIGDEFGPFLLHCDPTGKVLEAPFPLPDFDNPGQEIRSPQNPLHEEASAVRVMQAVEAHAAANGNTIRPVFSPWHVMLMDDAVVEDQGTVDASFIDNRAAPPVGSGSAPAESEIFDVSSIQAAGYDIVTWTVNDKPRMLELMALGVNGIISDRPDLLLEAVQEFDAANPDAGFIGEDGLIDIEKFDAQGHRGGRDLRPENTLPAVEVALDNLMTTIESDMGVAHDAAPMVNHDPQINPAKCRRVDGVPFGNDVFVRDLASDQIQAEFICDQIIRDPAVQTNDPALSPVTAAFAAEIGLPDIYVMPTVQNLFDFVEFYVAYYGPGGPGEETEGAAARYANAQRVRFNLETKLNPRQQFAARTIEPEPFTDAVLAALDANPAFAGRVDIQSFDFRTLLLVHEKAPEIRTVFLFGDFPIFDDPSISGSDDGTNLQDENGANTPWLAGLPWPYRQTRSANPFRLPRSGGFEGMALSRTGRELLPLLERPLVGDATNSLLINTFDLAKKEYTGDFFRYALDPQGTNIGDFLMFNPRQGLIIERDGGQGPAAGLKRIYQITLQRRGGFVKKDLVADLLNLANPGNIALPTDLPTDFGLGDPFQFPFVTVEAVLVADRDTILVTNDNNFPFSVGRHVGDPADPSDNQVDDNEFILIDLDKPLPGVR